MRATVVALHVMVLALGALVGLATDARAQDVIRIGCPTKTYFPTILATVAKDRGLFEKEGLRPEITIYRGGAETFGVGDRLAIINEDPADATLADLSITFLGKRT